MLMPILPTVFIAVGFAGVLVSAFDVKGWKILTPVLIGIGVLGFIVTENAAVNQEKAAVNHVVELLDTYGIAGYVDPEVLLEDKVYFQTDGTIVVLQGDRIEVLYTNEGE